ncbi:sugar transferase [Candidatus Saccharibacteria bacterium]|nr:sugar transferase [Candidatus Saccharibacteria bacterium]
MSMVKFLRLYDIIGVRRLGKPKEVSKKMFYLFVKRVFDIVVSLVGLIFLVPVALIIKIAYLCEKDTHPIIYGQTRIGKNEKEFKILKFRSMVWDADEKLEELLKKEKYRKQWEEFRKIDDDPRVTKVGKTIRIGSIDETPQFINVFLGQMSLIGPRPLVPGELKAHKGKKEIYYSVKPGITGYWATRGRSDVDYDDRLKMEYFYVENCGLILDIKILFRTVRAIFKKNGAK